MTTAAPSRAACARVGAHAGTGAGPADMPPSHQPYAAPAHPTGPTTLRREYGMVFRLEFPSRNYFTVFKDG